MDSSGTERKRALSFSGLSSVGTKLNIGLGSETDHPNYVRIRHPSFALATERPSILDGLIGAASNKIRSSTDKDAIPDGTNSSSNKSSSTFNHVQCPTEASQTKEPLTVQVIAALDDVDGDFDSRRTSSATVVAPFLSSYEWDGYSSPVGSRHTINADSLSSAVLKLYLSELSHGNENRNSSKTVITPLGSTTPRSAEPQSHDVHVPEYFQLHVPAVASMTMPVNQITRAYSRFYGNSTRFGRNIPTVTVHPLYERNALTDANYSSGLSDSDSRNSPKNRGKATCGYQSDHHMLEATSEVRKLQMTGRRLEQDFRSTASLSSSPGRPRPHSGNSTPITKRRISNSARNSKFDLTQVYDGLLPQKTPISPSPSSEWSVSNGSLDATLLNRFTPPLLGPLTAKSGCITPPGSPISAEAFGRMRSTSNEQCCSSNAPTTLDRLRSMLSNLKPNLQDDESNKYFYMDEQSLERRAQAQVSNVIAPVSF